MNWHNVQILKQALHRPGMAQFWLDKFIIVEYYVMNCQLGLINIKHQDDFVYDDGYSNGSCDYDGLGSGMGDMQN